jgi:hypothetical protein
MVGLVRFELTTPSPPDWCAAWLRYSPLWARIGADDGQSAPTVLGDHDRFVVWKDLSDTAWERE